jgi:hypothetical protein
MKKERRVVQMWEDAFYLENFSQHQCCHCSLVHDVEYTVENGRIFTRWKENKRETAKARKLEGITITRKPVKPK